MSKVQDLINFDFKNSRTLDCQPKTSRFVQEISEIQSRNFQTLVYFQETREPATYDSRNTKSNTSWQENPRLEASNLPRKQRPDCFFFDSKHKQNNEQEKDWQLKQKKLRVNSDFRMNSTATVVMNSTTTVSPREQYSFFCDSRWFQDSRNKVIRLEQKLRFRQQLKTRTTTRNQSLVFY